MLQLAPRVVVYQAGEAVPEVAPGVVCLAQVPSRAFGDGSHPTTRLCAGAVDVLARSAESVLDVGTGTGILARIARARGARRIVATDIDAHACEAAMANAALDRDISAEVVVQKALPDESFALVVANILQRPLLMLAPQLIAAVAPRGHLLLSGFSQGEAPILRAAYSRLHLVSESQQDGWVLSCLRREA